MTVKTVTIIAAAGALLLAGAIGIGSVMILVLPQSWFLLFSRLFPRKKV